MRDFLFSEIAMLHGMPNLPSDPDLAIETGTRLCEDLLEPLQHAFGRIAVRSAYRSTEVNGFGNAMQRQNRKGYNCASNEANAAGHIWDLRDAEGGMGATACIVVSALWDQFGHEAGGWRRLAWWIHDHLPYSSLEFFPTYWAFNITWHERPVRRIDSFVEPRGCLTRPGMDNHGGSHEHEWRDLVAPAR